MANKYKKVTINVSNDELNALEDYLNVDFEGDKETCMKDLKDWLFSQDKEK